MNKLLTYLTTGLSAAYLALAPLPGYSTSTPLHQRLSIKKHFLPDRKPIMIPTQPLELRLPNSIDPQFQIQYPDTKYHYRPNFMPTPEKMKRHEDNQRQKGLQRLPPVN